MNDSLHNARQEEEPLLTAEELAAKLQVSKATVDKLGREGTIPRIVFSAKVIRYRLSEVVAARTGSGP